MENLSHLNAHFNFGTEHYEVHPPEWQRKGALIQDINTIQLTLNKGCVDEKQFEELMYLPISVLAEIVSDHASLLARAKALLQPQDGE